ncbi:MAG: glycosyltransferase family 2 protein [Patescibacteria group bacterium]|jgi:GT2 family glycosyltransferase|nr:glycosyltransferase family 2 protein [Patescibacteria group bacterium]
MDLSIIIVNYNNLGKLANCLDSFSKSNLSDLQHEIIVVDNNSEDDLRLLSRVIDFKIINSEKNLGMGGGNNLGIKESKADIVLVLNPDTIVNGPAIKELYNYLKENKEVGLVGPKLLYPDGSLQYSCAKFPNFFIPILRRTFLGDKFKKKRDDFMMLDFDHKSIKEIDWVMGSCLMFKKSWEYKEEDKKDEDKKEEKKEEEDKEEEKDEDKKEEKKEEEDKKEEKKEDSVKTERVGRYKSVQDKEDEKKDKKDKKNKKKSEKDDDGLFHVLFDERYFMYFEDIDLCREVKEHGKKVIYNPNATIIHDHARDSAKNPWYVALFKDKITWIHISSWIKYFLKWGFKSK